MFPWYQVLFYHFPDYKGAIKKLPVVKQNHGIHLRALTDFTDDDGVTRPAGAEWQLRGPLTYVPQPEVVSSRLHGQSPSSCTTIM